MKRLVLNVLAKRRTEIREARYFEPSQKRAALFDDLLADYRKWAEREGKAIIKGVECWERLLRTFGGKRAPEIKLRDIEDFAHAMRERVSVATSNRNLTLLRAIFNRALKHGRITESPMREMKLAKENNTRVRFIEEAEEARLIEALPERFRPLVIVALHTGARRGELLALRWNDIDFATDTITIRKSKSGEGRRIPMNSIAAETLRSVRQRQIREGAPTLDLSAIVMAMYSTSRAEAL